MTDDELITEHDSVAPYTQVGLSYYEDELNRRAGDRAIAASQALAHKIYVLTIVAAGSSFLAVVVAAIAIVLGQQR